MPTPDQHEHAIKLKDDVTWVIDGLQTFAAADPEHPVSVRALAWVTGLTYLLEDLDRVIDNGEPGNPGDTRWRHEDVVAAIATLLVTEGKGSEEGAVHMARTFIEEWRRAK